MLKKNIIYFLLLIGTLHSPYLLQAQAGWTAAQAMQICAGVTVPAKVSSGTAEAGPAYGCLGDYPNPTWMFAKIGTSGTLSFTVSIAPSSDVDFIVWGPFAAPPTAAQLTAGMIKSCDYSGANGGTAALGSVTAGQYYMILLTNYGNAAGNIALTVAGGSTATIECPSPGGLSATMKYWAKANAGTSSTVNAAQVATWNDQTPTGWHATQATAAARPTFVANAVNFNPALNFNSTSSQYLNLASISGFPSGNKSFFAVTVPTTLNGSGTNGIMGCGGTLQESQFGYQNGKINTYEAITGVLLNALSTTTYSAGAPLLASSIRDGLTASLFNSGAADGSNLSISLVNVTANRLTIGAHNVNGGAKNYWNGQIAEIIMFGTALTDPERFKVETYLAMKYGITLSHNYVSATNVTLWDMAANTGYNNDITAIAREDVSSLHQKQAKSVETSALITIGNTAIAASNVLNTNVLTDNSFMLFGDNGGSLTWQGAGAPNSRQRLTRAWKVQESGTVGSVKLQIPDNSSALAHKLPSELTTVYLLVDTDNDFSTGATEVAMTLNGTNWEATYDFAHGNYFTMATQMPVTPGCISDIPTLWLKADKGATPVAGGTLTGWANQANSITMLMGNAPTLVPNGTNFNPSVQFNGTTNYLQGSGDIVNSEAFAVFQNTNADGTPISYTTPTSSGASVYFLRDMDTDLVSGAASADGTSYDYAFSAPLPNGVNLAQTSLADDVIRVNGANQGGTYNWIASHTKTPMIGRRYGGAGGVFDSYLNGTISEVLIFGTTLTNAKREAVESYLAIKYGITLAHNYFSPSQTILFAGNGGSPTDFDANIFGLGRSDCQELHQKQSKSLNANGILTIGLTTISATNALNTNNLTDETYLLIGDNNVAAGATAFPNGMAAVCPPPVGMTGLFNRTWKAQETGAVGATLLQVATANLTGLSANQPIYLVVADDNTLTTNVKYILMTTNGSNQEVSYDFDGTKYFSFAGSLESETVCTGYHYVRWATQGWTAGSLTKTVTLNNGLTMTTTVADPQSVLRSGYPKLYQGLPSAYISTNSASKSITWTSEFNQIIASCNFSVYDIDNIGTLAEHIEVKGYKGATVVNPTLSRAAISSVLVNGTISTGQINNTEPYSPYAKVNVSFNEPMDKVVITYKNNKNTLYPRGAMMLLSDFAIFCPAPVANVDKIMLFKIAPSGNIHRGDTINYTFQFNNADCAAKTVNFTDVLPAGFTWSPNSLITPLNGTLNNYGGTNTISITNMSVPTGLSTFTLSAYAGAAAGTHNNQATFVVNGTTYPSDDPNQAGTSNSTPITLIAAPTTAPLAMTKAVSAASVLSSGILTFTYTFNNTGGSAILTDFTDEIQPDTVRYKASSLTFGAGMTGTANAYANISSLYINNLSIPTGTSTMTIQVEMNDCAAGDYQNVAMLIPTAASGFREKEITSNEINWAVVVPASFQYAYNCNGSTVQGNFIANGAAGQMGSIRLGINVLNTGTSDLTVTGTGFTGSLTTTLNANTNFVILPITYNGSGSDGSRTLTISSPNGIGTCTANLNIGAVCKAAGGRIGQ